MKTVKVNKSCMVTVLSRRGHPAQVGEVTAKEFQYETIVAVNPSYVVYAKGDNYYVFPADVVTAPAKTESLVEWIETPDSSQVEKFAYRALDESLDVQFKSGGLYRYSGVPADVVEEMKRAESVGKFLNKSIKGTYEFKKLS